MTAGKRILYGLLLVLFVVAALKILFVGYDVDEQYAVSMAYRMVKGDRLLADMWEPHQTSGWLCMILMVPYVAIFQTATGIILYLRVCGLLLHSAVGYCLYRTLRSYLDREYAFLNSSIYFFSLPKIMFLPEFSNIQVWCLIMAACCMVRYYGPLVSQPGNSKKRDLFWAGCFMALEVMSYPSTFLAFIVCICCMIRYRRHSYNSLGKELFCLIFPCVLGALIFMVSLLTYIPLNMLGKLISIVASDGSHSAPWRDRMIEHSQSLGQVFMFFVVYSLIASLFVLLHRLKTQKPFSVHLWCEALIGCTLIGQVCIWVFGDKYPNYPMVEYIFLPIFFFCAIIRRKVQASSLEYFFVMMPIAAFLGVLLFSNHPLLVSLPFLAPCVIGIISLSQQSENGVDHIKKAGGMSRGLLVLWVCVLLFGRCYMQRTTGGCHETVFDDLSLMRGGPAAGIIADTSSVVCYQDNLKLITDVLPDNTRVFYIGSHTDMYLMKELKYCIPSTISSPTYNDLVLSYFEQHPDKQPEYIVCDAELIYTNLWVNEYVGKVCRKTPVAANDFLMVYRVIKNCF